MVLSSNKSRSYHLGPYPLERITRDEAVLAVESARPRGAANGEALAGAGVFAAALEKYHQIFHSLRADLPAPDARAACCRHVACRSDLPRETRAARGHGLHR